MSTDKPPPASAPQISGPFGFARYEDLTVIRPSGNETPWYWLSFADPNLPEGSQFLGVCVVQAGHFFGAVTAAGFLGLNPGGEVQGTELPAWATMPETFRNRLLQKDELAELEAGFLPGETE